MDPRGAPRVFSRLKLKLTVNFGVKGPLEVTLEVTTKIRLKSNDLQNRNQGFG